MNDRNNFYLEHKKSEKSFKSSLLRYKELIEYFKAEYLKYSYEKSTRKVEINVKKEMVLGIFFNRSELLLSSIFGLRNFNKEDFKIHFYYDDYGYNINPGYIINMNDQRELRAFLVQQIDKYFWQDVVKNGDTTLGYDEWKKNVLESNEINDKLLRVFYSSKHFHKIELPELFKEKFLIVYSK